MLFCTFATAKASAYKDLPALIYLNRAEQPDTVGFNLVEGMAHLVFDLLKANKINLIEAPGKPGNIGLQNILAIDQSAKTNFVDLPDLFIYEYWTSTKNSSEFKIVGFSFVNRSANGEKVSYGYIDLITLLPYLRARQIKNNANGFAKLSFEQALLSRRYQYFLLQLGEEQLQNQPIKAVKEKIEAFHGSKKVINQYQAGEEKRLHYRLNYRKYRSDIDYSGDIIEGIKSLLQQNPELYYNIGAYRWENFPKKFIGTISITSLEVEEIIAKNKNDLNSKSFRLKINFDNEQSSDWISLSSLEAYGLLIKLKTLHELLQNKQFEFTLLQINDEAIDSKQTLQWMQNLKEKNWNNLRANAR